MSEPDLPIPSPGPPPHPCSCDEVPVTVNPRWWNNASLREAIIRVLDTNRDYSGGITTKSIGAAIASNRGIHTPSERAAVRESVARTLRRIRAADDRISWEQVGREVYYLIEATPEEVMEATLESSIRVEEWDPPTLHSVHILFNPAKYPGDGMVKEHPDNLRGRPTRPPSAALRGLGPAAVYKRWAETCPSWGALNHKVNGGYQEKLVIGNGVKTTVQQFQTGAWQIHCKIGDPPIDIREYLHLEQELRGLWYARTGYDLRAWDDYATVWSELQDDLVQVGEVGATILDQSSGKFAHTIRTWRGIVRFYTKKLGDEPILRRETTTEEIPYREWVSEQVAAIHGGVNTQWLIRQAHLFEKALTQLAADAAEDRKALKFLLHQAQRGGSQ